eukprot:GHVH01002061.1.p1 GENE.GHVH01002061.1~~GHVH01002061.1.p1  ORF type:complete len:836 (+),score=118.77 GHVH01002061.1:1254-3761(+)
MSAELSKGGIDQVGPPAVDSIVGRFTSSVDALQKNATPATSSIPFPFLPMRSLNEVDSEAQKPDEQASPRDMVGPGAATPGSVYQSGFPMHPQIFPSIYTPMNMSPANLGSYANAFAINPGSPVSRAGGDQTTSAANMARNLSSGTALRHPSQPILDAIEMYMKFDLRYEHESYDPVVMDRTPIEVVVGTNPGEFHVGSILNVHPSESSDSIESTNGFEWVVVDFEQWGSMKVPAIRCRHSSQPYPLPLVDRADLNQPPASPSKGNDVAVSTNLNGHIDEQDAASDASPDSPAPNAISPPQWSHSWSTERKPPIIPHRAGDVVDLFRPETDASPPCWVRSKVTETLTEDPRVVLNSKLPIALPVLSPVPSPRADDVPHDPLRAPTVSEPWHCATYWGGYCQCSLHSSPHACLGLKGGIINADEYPLFYYVEWTDSNTQINTVLVPWQFVRAPNNTGGLAASEISESEFALPPFLTSVPMSSMALNTLTEEARAAADARYVASPLSPVTVDQVWIDSAHSKRLLNQIRHFSKILLYQVKRDDNHEYKITFIGPTSSALTANQYLNEAIAHIKSSIEFYERREKRLKLLEERKSRYEKNEQLEFEADDSLVGLIIGKQGEHLSKVARMHKVEIRVLPDDEGFRRVRIYGGSLSNAQKAKHELNYCFKYLQINADASRQLSDRRGYLMKEIAQRFSVNSIWIDVGNSDMKSGVRDATVMAAAQQASQHPIKCRDIIRGTPSNPVLVICGVEEAVKKINAAIQKSVSTPSFSLADLLGISQNSNLSWSTPPSASNYYNTSGTTTNCATWASRGWNGGRCSSGVQHPSFHGNKARPMSRK